MDIFTVVALVLMHRCCYVELGSKNNKESKQQRQENISASRDILSANNKFTSSSKGTNKGSSSYKGTNTSNHDGTNAREANIMSHAEICEENHHTKKKEQQKTTTHNKN